MANRQIVSIAGKTININTFGITSDDSIITGTANKKNYIVAISFHNNETTETDDEQIFLRDGSPSGTPVYGSGAGAIYIPGRGGVFQLSMSLEEPWFNTGTGSDLYMDLTNGRDIGGAVWYYVE